MKKLFRAVPLILMLVCLNAGWSSATLLQNGDFSSGFSGWNGYIGQDSGGGLVVTYADLNSGDSHFNVSSGAAVLTNDVTFYQIILSQVFELPAISSTLTFDYLWTPQPNQSAIIDTFQASFAVWNSALSDFDSPMDLFNGLDPLAGSLSSLAFDMTPYAGQTIRLDFILTDNDYLVSDKLQIDNVMASTTPVPEPGTLIMLGAGLSVLLLFSRRGSQNKTL